jgi:hypothetical protein
VALWRAVEGVDKAGRSIGDEASLRVMNEAPGANLGRSGFAFEQAVDGQKDDCTQQRHEEAGALTLLV